MASRMFAYSFVVFLMIGSFLLVSCRDEEASRQPAPDARADRGPAERPQGDQAEPPREKTLTEQLAERRAESAARIPPERKAVMDRAQADLERSGIAQAAIGQGDTAPDFALPDVNGETVRLSELRARGPVVVSFYRGGWCPYCNLALAALQREMPRIIELGATVAAISPQVPDESLSTAQKQQLTFHVLSDVGNKAARQYGLVFQLPPELVESYKGFGLDLSRTHGDDRWELPVPATYVIDTDGKVVLAFVDTDYTRRLDPKDIVAKLEEMKPKPDPQGD